MQYRAILQQKTGKLRPLRRKSLWIHPQQITIQQIHGNNLPGQSQLSPPPLETDLPVNPIKRLKISHDDSSLVTKAITALVQPNGRAVFQTCQAGDNLPWSTKENASNKYDRAIYHLTSQLEATLEGVTGGNAGVASKMILTLLWKPSMVLIHQLLSCG